MEGCSSLKIVTSTFEFILGGEAANRVSTAIVGIGVGIAIGLAGYGIGKGVAAARGVEEGISRVAESGSQRKQGRVAEETRKQLNISKF